jgi:hypothetical protein
MDDLATFLSASTAAWLLILAGVTTLAFALSAFACESSAYFLQPARGCPVHLPFWRGASDKTALEAMVSAVRTCAMAVS